MILVKILIVLSVASRPFNDNRIQITDMIIINMIL